MSGKPGSTSFYEQTGLMRNDKYATGEFERRFLLSETPAGVEHPKRIVDHYVDGTRLRVRSVSEQATSTPQRKLGHKRRLTEDDPTAVMHTSLYLNEAEFEVLVALPGRRLVKTRWSLTLGDHAFCVDVFEEDLTGLIVLEVDLGDPETLKTFAPPAWAGPEITHIEDLTGGGLAGKTYQDIVNHIPAAQTG